MSGTVADKKRLIRLTAGNIRNKHLYVANHLDFFPDDIVGPPQLAESQNGRSIKIHLDGVGESIETDIGSDAQTGKPRRMFRRRDWVRKFIDYHNLQAGDVLAIERRGERDYRLYPFHAKPLRNNDWHKWLETPPPSGNGPTVIELFAGCGGMALGFKRAGYRAILANEWDASACQTLNHNITERIAQCAVEEIDMFPRADVVVGGPPCQGFSNLGEKVPDDPRRQMWRHFMRAVEQSQAEAFVMENVPPLLKSQEFVEISRIAKYLGFNISAKILNSADYGVPQTRKRLIIIGLRSGHPTHPLPSHYDPNKHSLLTKGLRPWMTVRDAIGDLSPIPTEENWHIGRNPTPKSLERYKHIPPGGNRFDLPRHLTPPCWIRKTKGGTDLMGRLWWDRPSVTIGEFNSEAQWGSE